MCVCVCARARSCLRVYVRVHNLAYVYKYFIFMYANRNAEESNIEGMCKLVEELGPTFDRAVEFLEEEWMSRQAPAVPGAYV